MKVSIQSFIYVVCSVIVLFVIVESAVVSQVVNDMYTDAYAINHDGIASNDYLVEQYQVRANTLLQYNITYRIGMYADMLVAKNTLHSVCTDMGQLESIGGDIPAHAAYEQYINDVHIRDGIYAQFPSLK